MSGTTKTMTPEDLAKVSGGAQIHGTEGADAISTYNNRAPSGDDLVFAGGGNDGIATYQGNDQVHAGAGDDSVLLGDGNDLAFGGDGNDVVHMGAGSDQVRGGAGNEMVIGSDGDRAQDLVFGETGDDMYSWSPGSGSDQFHGGEGRDTFIVQGMTMEGLRGALQSYDPNLTLKVDGKELSFVNAAGQPQSFSGHLQVGGETVQFFGVERIYLS